MQDRGRPQGQRDGFTRRRARKLPEPYAAAASALQDDTPALNTPHRGADEAQTRYDREPAGIFPTEKVLSHLKIYHVKELLNHKRLR
ncbi:MAG: hypothetical protein ACREVJ_05930, partial [Gammaproteobacteria bacterium]